MIEICGDLVRHLPCVQQASYLEGGPLMWMLSLYLNVNQKSNYDDDIYGLQTGHTPGGHMFLYRAIYIAKEHSKNPFL